MRLRSGTVLRPTLLLLLSATFVSCSATDAAGSVLAGPWMLLRADGGIEIGLELAGGGPYAGTIVLKRLDPAATGPVAIHPAWRPLLRAGKPPSEVLSIVLPSGDAAAGRYRLDCAERSFTIALPARPGAAAAARIAVVGGWNYPSSLDMEHLGTSLGGPVQMAVALGREVGERLGTGGWETSIPLMLMGTAYGQAAARDDAPPAIIALAGSSLDQWPGGARWGPLGLPSASDEERAGRAIGTDLSPWQVFIAPKAEWNPGLLAPGQDAGTAALLPLIAVCQHMHVPVILAGATGAGWVSEPLGLERGKIAATAGGTRYVGAIPAGEGLAEQPDEIAMPVDQAALVGVSADPAHLVVALRALGGDDLFRLVYEAGAERADQQGPGWGNGDVGALKQAWLDGGAGAGQALDDLGWLTAQRLAGLHITSGEFATLLAASAKDPRALRLLRRLAGVDPLVVGIMERQLATLPPLLGRDVLLRQLAHEPLLFDGGWSRFAAASQDPLLVRALLLAYDRHPGQDLLELLLARVRLQADGTVPLEADALLEHRLLVAVFDATTLSPTSLRPLAVALRAKVDGLARGPIERFIARHGAVRPP